MIYIISILKGVDMYIRCRYNEKEKQAEAGEK